jgi:hypothetical protein
MVVLPCLPGACVGSRKLYRFEPGSAGVRPGGRRVVHTWQAGPASSEPARPPEFRTSTLAECTDGCCGHGSPVGGQCRGLMSMTVYVVYRDRYPDDGAEIVVSSLQKAREFVAQLRCSDDDSCVVLVEEFVLDGGKIRDYFVHPDGRYD